MTMIIPVTRSEETMTQSTLAAAHTGGPRLAALTALDLGTDVTMRSTPPLASPPVSTPVSTPASTPVSTPAPTGNQTHASQTLTRATLRLVARAGGGRGEGGGTTGEATMIIVIGSTEVEEEEERRSQSRMTKMATSYTARATSSKLDTKSCLHSGRGPLGRWWSARIYRKIIAWP